MTENSVRFPIFFILLYCTAGTGEATEKKGCCAFVRRSGLGCNIGYSTGTGL